MCPNLMRRCSHCGEYTLNQLVCPRCGGNVHIAKPPKFSLEDRYAKYRRALKGKPMQVKS